jgi:hypothetical protein
MTSMRWIFLSSFCFVIVLHSWDFDIFILDGPHSWDIDVSIVIVVVVVRVGVIV